MPRAEKSEGGAVMSDLREPDELLRSARGGGRGMSRLDTRIRRQGQASKLLGVDVREIPKASLAVVAAYLALALDESLGFDGARERFWQEWDTLHGQGIIETAAPCRARQG